ncbi:MAG: hypothetical protein Q8Q80_08430 [Methyloversatilis sp.]|uniref:hypothetical protein n=1 Tax=Methyloversatilis sp. TaxID=2569862 RepID=UPI002732E0D4|nr:hypothetical protein [Methyloversatilis sp.]MDP3872675.1 hypothetical protein [Methyloversatilis sp.]
MPSIDLTSLFARQREVASDRGSKSPGFNRLDYTTDSGVSVLIDSFAESTAACVFIRCTSSGSIRLSLEGEYRFARCAAGGWLLKPYRITDDFFWLPAPPMSRSLDHHGHILSHKPALVSGAEVSPEFVSLEFENTDTNVVDIVVWKLPEYLLADLQQLDHMERRPYFLWSSHTAYKIPADVYLHLVNGHVYENHEVWPKYWRVCSELDAYALYVTLSGLLRGTGKKIYELMRRQIVFSVVARQSSDGGWYHGEWTDEMESHYRLHAAGMLLLAAYFEEAQDPVVGEAIKRACAFAAARIDRIDSGVWYLHDSLEETEETLKRYPFRYEISRALGKSRSNLMVLNTHLDTNVAMERCRQVTGSEEFSVLIESARETSVAVCALKPAEWLYRPLFRAVALTLLPPSAGAALPLPLRAIKRITWKYIIPLLPRIKARFPRLVMPGGFIERDLAQHSFSVRYQPVNLMDLVRTRRIFGEVALDPLLEECFAFTQHSGIKERWKELAGKEDDSLGFWAEALYHMCLLEDDRRYRAWLADAVIYLDDARLGLSPSLLGCNAEAVAPKLQTLCPRPSDPRLCVTNLSKSPQLLEYLVINPSHDDIVLEWKLAPVGPVQWHDSGDTRREEKGMVVPARSWVQGVTVSPVEVGR